MTTLMDDKIVVGLDIGSTKVCAVAGRLVRHKDHSTLEVLGVGRVEAEGVAKGSVVNINKTVDAIEKAIEEAGNQSDIDIRLVNVAFSGKDIEARRQAGIITRSSPGDEVTSLDIDHLLSDMYRNPVSPGKEIVHVLPMDFTVDNEPGVEDPVGRNGVKLGAEFQIITAPVGAAINIRKCLERASSGLKRDQIVLSALASGMAVLSDDEKRAGVALVDIGGGTTDIAIYHRNVLRYVSVLPWAGKSLTNDIEMGCKVLPNQAETLKTKFGTADPADYKLNEVVSVPGLVNRPPKDVLLKNVSIIIEERLKELAALIQSEIVRAGYEHKLLGGIVLTGGTASIDGIERVFNRVTGMDIRIGYPDKLERNARADLVSDPAYATALGLVWAGFRQIDERISFISDPGRALNNEEAQRLNPRENINGTKEKEPVKKKTGFFGMIRDFISGENYNPSTDRYE